jgi:hypothetical protein
VNRRIDVGYIGDFGIGQPNTCTGHTNIPGKFYIAAGGDDIDVGCPSATSYPYAVFR